MQVRLNSTLRGRIGQRVFDVDLPDCTTLRQLLLRVFDDAPGLSPLLLDGDGKLYTNIVIFLGGRNIEFFDGLETELHAADVIDIFPKTGAQRAFVTE